MDERKIILFFMIMIYCEDCMSVLSIMYCITKSELDNMLILSKE